MQELDKSKMEADKAKKREEAKAKRAKEMAEKKRGKLGIAGSLEGHDQEVDELFGAIEDGRAFKNRRARKGGDDFFIQKHEALVREKPLPQPKKKAAKKEDLE
jgi:hypothetical protein